MHFPFVIAVKAGNPSNKEYEGLSRKLSDKWKKLGRQLKFERPELTAYDKQNDQLDEKAYNMLMDWKLREGRDATYEVLYRALCDEAVACKGLAEHFFAKSSNKTKNR